MRNTISFNEALETAEKLPIEDQETLIEILNRRIIEKQQSRLEKSGMLRRNLKRVNVNRHRQMNL